MNINELFNEFEFDKSELHVYRPYCEDESGSDMSYGHLHNLADGRTHLQDGEEVYYIPQWATGSDYSGGSVTVANHKHFLAEYGEFDHVREVYGGHGTYAVAFNLSSDDWNEETVFWLIDDMENLSDYPVLDDDVLCEVEREAEEEAWENWLGEYDFPKAIMESINHYYSTQSKICADMAIVFYNLSVQGAPTREVHSKLLIQAELLNEREVYDIEGSTSFDGPLCSLFRELMEKTNSYWENETGNSAYVRLENICDASLVLASEHWTALVKSGAVEYRESE